MSCSSCLYLQVNILQKLRAWFLYNRHENTKLRSPYLTDPGTLSWPVQLVFKQPEAEADRRLQLRFVKETPPASSCLQLSGLSDRLDKSHVRQSIQPIYLNCLLLQIFIFYTWQESITRNHSKYSSKLCTAVYLSYNALLFFTLL